MYQAENSGDLLKNKRDQLGSRQSWLSVGQTVLLLGVTSLLTDISAEMVSTTLPLYLLITLQFTPFQIGLIDGLYQGAAVLVKLLSGIVADRWQRPKEVATAGYLLSMFSKLGFLFMGGSWTAISSVVVLDRIGKGIRTAPRDAMIAATSTKERLATAFGVHRAMDTAGAMLGPLLAVAILMIAPGSYDAVFVVSSCIALIGVAVIAIFVRNPEQVETTEQQAHQENRHHAEAQAERHTGGRSIFKACTGCSLLRACRPEHAVSLQSALRLLLEPRFGLLVLIGTLFALATVSDSLLYLNLQRSLELSTGFFPLLFVLSALIFMVLAIPVGWLADRVGAKRIFLLGYGVLAAAYGILLLPGQSYVTAAAVLLLLGVYYACTDGVLMALASQSLPVRMRTTGLSLLTTGTGLARLLASTLYGIAWNQFGADRALLIFSIGLIVTIVIAMFVIKEIEQKERVETNHG